MSQRAPIKRCEPAIEGHTTPVLLTGRLLTGSTLSSLLVNVPVRGPEPLRARTTLPLDSAALERAVLTAQPVTIAFEDGDPARPIVTGFIQPAPPLNALHTLLLSQKSSQTASAHQPRTEARVDGKRVVIEGRDEVVLKCGDSSITLRKDGKVVLRGAYVETHSRGVNRIKGASVKIN
jgi:hypothetical protein